MPLLSASKKRAIRNHRAHRPLKHSAYVCCYLRTRSGLVGRLALRVMILEYVTTALWNTEQDVTGYAPYLEH